jgi:hypothetical protein
MRISDPETACEMAERHLREYAAHVAAQAELVEQLRYNGHATAKAEELLTEFKRTLADQRERLSLLRKADRKT